MRKIIFRGKRLDNGEWVASGNLLHANDNGKHSYYIPVYNDKFGTIEDEHDNILRIDYGTFYKVDPATVGQYTGLNDKNGKRIFEGDIVRIERAEWGFDGMSTDYRTEQGVIVYDDWGSVGLVVDKYENRPVWSDFFHVCGLTDRVHDWSFEVIGNIYDNPELVEGGEQNE